MTREQAKELLPIIQAWVNNKEVQWQATNDRWLDNIHDTCLFESDYKWRIKPEPREFWLCDGYQYDSRGKAESYRENSSMEIIHVKEVI